MIIYSVILKYCYRRSLQIDKPERQTDQISIFFWLAFALKIFTPLI